MCGVMVGNEDFLTGGTPRKGYPIAFHLAGNPPIGMMGAYPDERQDIEGRRQVVPGCQRVIAGCCTGKRQPGV